MPAVLNINDSINAGGARMMQMQTMEDLFDLSALGSLQDLDESWIVTALDEDRAPYPAASWFGAWAATGNAPP